MYYIIICPTKIAVFSKLLQSGEKKDSDKPYRHPYRIITSNPNPRQPFTQKLARATENSQKQKQATDFHKWAACRSR